MDDDLQKLKLLKIEQIYDKTHISRRNIEYILSKSFDRLDKIQFNGFLSILEREYSLDLQDLKNEYDKYYLERPLQQDPLLDTILKPQKKEIKIPKKAIVISLIIIVGIIIIYLFLSYLSQYTKKQSNTLTNIPTSTVIKINKENTTITDKNISKINNIQPIPIKKSPKIEFITKSKLWIGITNLDTWKQVQKIIKHNIELNATKNYLFVLGHGMIKVNINDKNITFPHIGKVWLMYKDGKLTTLTQQQYQQLNKGRAW